MSGIECATLFTPGRGSYLDTYDVLQLSEASRRRADVAAKIYDADIHDAAVYAGGFPGLALGWDESLTPPTDRREAYLMAVPLTLRLESEKRSSSEIGSIVLTQGDSSNSFGDVILSLERGLLNPNTFNSDPSYGIDLTTGALHGKRFRSMLSLALDIDPLRIRRVPMWDVYGRHERPHQPAVSAQKAIAKELASIAATELVLRKVKPGDLEGLRDAEQRFIAIASRHN